MRDYCFVAQPFDGSVFDERYNEIIEPAIRACGLEPYRVDRDTSVVIPVNSMEERISQASVVIAEITTDNPNVWYELGAAITMGKPTIMVCADEREPPYPFDIRHRSVLTYRTRTPKDYVQYEKNLRNAIMARYHPEDKGKNPVPLSPEEILVLKFIARDQKTIYAITPEEKILKSSLDQDAVLDCLKSLMNQGYLEYSYSTDGMDSYYHITPKAEKLLSKK